MPIKKFNNKNVGKSTKSDSKTRQNSSPIPSPSVVRGVETKGNNNKNIFSQPKVSLIPLSQELIGKGTQSAVASQAVPPGIQIKSNDTPKSNQTPPAPPFTLNPTFKNNISVLADSYGNNSQFKNGSSAFDVGEGLSDSSPEIIMLTDFFPAYDDQGILNKTGKLLQSKQDAILVSANASIKSIFSSPEYTSINNGVQNNKTQILEFIETAASNIDSLLSNFHSIKKKFDCRVDIDNKTLSDLGFSQISDYGYPVDANSVLFDQSNEHIKFWTPTKVWIQMCLELKQILSNGHPVGLLGLSTIPALNADEYYKNPYILTNPRSSQSKVLSFNKSQLEMPSLLSKNYDISEVNFNQVIVYAKSLFDEDKYPIFNQKIYTDGSNIGESIAKLSTILCREYLYSFGLKSAFAGTDFNRFGYNPALGSSKLDFWDYASGRVGFDITDVSENPIGGGNSLVSLCQSIETEKNGTKVEVLTFEDRYIEDNINSGVKTDSSTSTITPGSYYYLESSINTANYSFDISRLEILSNKLKNSLSLLDYVTNNLLPPSQPAPYASIADKVLDNLGASQKNEDKNSSSVSPLSSPVLLLKTLEQKILSNSTLLRRSPTPTLWSNDVSWDDFGKAQNYDYSPLLISAAIEDKELKSLLFMHQLSSIRMTPKINDVVLTKGKEATISKVSNVPGSKVVTDEIPSVTYKEKICQMIIDRLKKLFSIDETRKDSNLDSRTDLKVGPNLNILKSVLMDSKQEGIYVLSKIGETISDLTSNSTFTNSWFEKLTNIDTTKESEFTYYSSIQKVTFAAALFDLCLLIVHSSNPEKIICARPAIVNGSDQNLDLMVSRTTEPVLGYFDDKGNIVSKITENKDNVKKEEINQNITNLAALAFDEIFINSEKLAYDYNKSVLSYVNKFRCFLFSLKRDIENLKNSLISGIYSNLLLNLKDTLKNPNAVKSFFSQEQLMLARSRMVDLSIRLGSGYSSPIKKISPYFTTLKSSVIDDYLPLEDFPLISWNIALKDFLNQGSFRETNGFNKKIISIGIPRNLYRRFRIDASSLVGNSKKSGIIKLKIYRMDSLNPQIIHQPLEFLFDVKKYPTKLLGSYPLATDIIDGKANFNALEIPTLEATESAGTSTLKIVNNFIGSFSEGYEFLSEDEKLSIYNNHITSHFMEEYISFLSDINVNERDFQNTGEVIDYSLNPSEFNKFIGSASGTATGTNASIEKYFRKTLLSTPESIKNFVAMPRKFDRVFHIVFDPDDFSVDTDMTPDNIVQQKYRAGIIKKNELGNFVRTTSKLGDISFDGYFASIETYE